MDPSALGARPDALGAAAGRPMRGMLGGQNPQQPRMGLAGMRAPATSSKPLTAPGAPLVKPIKAPLGGTLAPKLVQPIQPKVVRKPLQPAPLVQPNVTPEVEDIPLPSSETSDISSTEAIPESTAELEAAVEEEVETAALRPITAVLSPASTPETVKTSTLKPLPPQLIPKKARGAPPNIARSKSSTSDGKDSSATLTPVRRMTPLKINKAEADSEEEENEDA